jgi:hypothetical protein
VLCAAAAAAAAGACAMCWYSSFVIITSHIEVECGLSHSHTACHFNSQYG